VQLQMGASSSLTNHLPSVTAVDTCYSPSFRCGCGCRLLHSKQANSEPFLFHSSDLPASMLGSAAHSTTTQRETQLTVACNTWACIIHC
jgi:hypothetical protein